MIDRDSVRALNELLGMARERLDRHPVLKAMASRIDVQESGPPVPGATGSHRLVITFDGPALPGRTTREMLASYASPINIDKFLDECEVQVAGEMRTAGLGG